MTVEFNNSNVKKKRGRKPKGKIIDYKKTVQVNSDEIPIIAHLNLNLNLEEDNTESDITETFKTNDIFISKEEDIDTVEKENIEVNVEKEEYDNEVKCWHCRNRFENKSVGLPECYFNGKFICTGHFCSFNCAMSYNLDLNDEMTMKRNSLINLMYQATYNTDEKIKPSPSWKTLKEYGGILTIEEFRENLNIPDDQYVYLHPPLVNKISQIIRESKKKSVPLSSISKFMETSEDLVLKRSKPLKSNRYNLKSMMGLKVKKKRSKKKGELSI